MINNILFLFFFLSAFESSAQVYTHPAAEKTSTRIAFGSCNNQREPQVLWEPILQNKPDLWVWLGDNIYADTKNMKRMAQHYTMQYNNKGYELLRNTTPVTGIWDDHDFGYDNVGKRYEKKQQSQQLFLDFMDIPADDPLREQKGIYRTYTLGTGDQKVKILLLDVRYFRDRLINLWGLYLPNRKGDVLGEAQWKWLEQELTNSDAKVHLICSGMQLLPDGRAYTNWFDFSNARKRMIRLLEEKQPAIPILLTGDRHVGELSKTNLLGYTYPLYEITSSGMTHHRKAKKRGNSFRVGEQVAALNFGVLDIDWGENSTTVTLQIRGEENKLLLEEVVEYREEDFK